MPQDAYQIIMDTGNLLFGAQATTAALSKVSSAFTSLEAVQNKYNSKGQVTQQIFKGIGTDGEQLALTLGKVSGQWKILGGTANTAARDLQAVKEQMRAASQQAAAFNQLGNNVRGLQSSKDAERIVGTTLKPGGSAQEIYDYNRSLATLKQFVAENKISAASIQRVWNDVNAGTFRPYVGTLGELQQKLFSVKKAIADVGTEQERLTRQSQGFLLSWQSVFRFFEARFLYNAISDIGQSIRQGIDRAVEFEQVLGRITTLAPTLAGGYREWGESVKRVSVAFGVDATDAAKSYYTALSNQIGNSISEIETFTRATAEFSKVTAATAEQSNNLFSSAINAFGLAATDATDIAGKFFKAIDLGRITAQGLAGSFGRTAVAASTLGVRLEDLLAGLSTLSRQGVTDADAQTQMLNLFNKLIKPTEKLKELYNEWGVESGQAAVATFGFTGVLEKLNTELETGGVARLGELINDIRGLRGTFGLTGKGIQEFKRDLGEISNAQNDYKRAVDLTAETMGFKWAKQINEVKTAFTGLGQDAISVLVGITEKFASLTTLIKAATAAAITLGAVMAGRLLNSAIAAATAIQVNFLRAGVAVRGVGASMLAFLGPGGLLLGLGAALGSYFLLAESTADKVQRVLTESLEKTNRALEASIAEREKYFSRLAEDTAKAFRPILQEVASVRSKLSADVTKLGESLQGMKKKMDDLGSATNLAFDRVMEGVRENVSELKQITNDIASDLNKAFRNEAIADFKDSIEELSSGKQAKAINSEIANVILNAKQLAERANLSLLAGNEDEARSLIEESRAYYKYATSLESDLKATSKAAIKEKIAAQKELESLSKKDTERAREELDLRASIGRTQNEILANRKRPGSREDANERELLLTSRLAGEKAKLVELEKQREEARKRVSVATEDAKGIDINRQLADLRRQSADALDLQLTTAKKLQEIEENKVKILEDQKLQLNIALNEAADLITKDDLNLTADQVKQRTDGIIKRYQEAVKKIQDTAGTPFKVDTEGLFQLLQVTNAIAEKSQKQSQIKDADTLREKAIEQENRLLKEQNDLKNKTNALDTKRGNTTAELVSKIAGLGRLVEGQLTSDGIATKAPSAVVAQFNATVKELETIGKLLRESPQLVDQYKGRLVELSNAFNALQSGEGNVRLSSAFRLGFDRGTDKNEAIESFRGVLAALLATQDQLDATQKETQTVDKTVEDLRRAFKETGDAGVTAFSNIQTQVRSTISSLEALKAAAQVSGAVIQTQAGGGIPKFAGGGTTYGSDKINALLSPGEFVVNPAATRKFYSQLVAMNSGTRNYAGGGNVTTNVGDVNVSMQSSGNASTDVARIGKLLRREIRRGTVKLH